MLEAPLAALGGVGLFVAAYWTVSAVVYAAFRATRLAAAKTR